MNMADSAESVLGRDILSRVFHFLAPQDLVVAAGVSRSWRDTVKGFLYPDYWKRYYDLETHKDCIPRDLGPILSWRDAYITARSGAFFHDTMLRSRLKAVPDVQVQPHPCPCPV